MIILITGSLGYIGKNVAERAQLEETAMYKNWNVLGVDLKTGIDVLSTPLPEVDCVIHLAAQAGAVPSTVDPVWDARNNILPTIRLAERYKGTKTKIIYTTSGAAKNPESPYGLSKKTGEQYLRMLAPENSVILRLSSIYGDKPRGVVDNFIRQWEQSQPVTIYGDGSATRDFVHVDDIARGILDAVKWKAGTYEMGSGVSNTIKELAEATGQEIIYKPEREGEIHTAVLKNTTPKKEGGKHVWQPTVDVIDFVRQQCQNTHE